MVIGLGLGSFVCMVVSSVCGDVVRIGASGRGVVGVRGLCYWCAWVVVLVLVASRH